MIKRFIAALSVLMVVGFCELASAGSIRDYGIYDLRMRWDCAVSRKFTTSLGDLTVEFINISTNPPNMKYHMRCNLNGRQIADVYWPQPTGRYYLKIFEDTQKRVLYIGMQATERTMLLGYRQNDASVRGIIDSAKVNSDGEGSPRLLVDDNELQLLFTSPYGEYGKRYLCDWNQGQNKFSFADVTKSMPAPVIASGGDDEDSSSGSTPESTEKPVEEGKAVYLGSDEQDAVMFDVKYE